MRDRRFTFAVLLGLLASSLCGLGCNLDNSGLEPPRAELNFPIAVTLSSEGDPEAGAAEFLYVANSNFDLQYNAGSVQAFDLDAVNEELDGCDARPCVLDSIQPFISSEVLVGSHVSGMALSPGGERIYLAVRSDSNLTYVDVEPARGGELECGGEEPQEECADAFRRGDDRAASARGIEVPRDPTGVVAGPLTEFGLSAAAGDYVLMSHRDSRVSFFVEERGGGAGGRDAPQLVHVASGFPENLVNIVRRPGTGVSWLMSSQERSVGRVSLAIDASTSEPIESFAFNAGNLRITNIETGRDDLADTRDVVFDPRPGVDRAYVLSRRPEALFVAELGARPGILDLDDVVPLGVGPSRLAQARVPVGDGRERLLVFASCFDSRDIYVIDPDLGQAVAIIRGMSGPFELVVDEARQRVYVADFRASAIRVADLSPLVACLAGDMEPALVMESPSCEPPILGSIGEPRPVGELL